MRFPHSLIMALLFSSAPWPKRLSNIAKGTRTHAFNLAKFVSIYKSAMFLQSSLSDTRGGQPKAGKLDPFWAGLLGGYIVFGERSPISEQIVLYVLSRVVTALLPREPVPEGAAQGTHQPIEKRTFTVLAALVWGVVMYQFQHHRERLAGGMVSSMKYLCESRCRRAAEDEANDGVADVDSQCNVQQANGSEAEFQFAGDSWSSWKTLLWRTLSVSHQAGRIADRVRQTTNDHHQGSAPNMYNSFHSIPCRYTGDPLKFRARLLRLCLESSWWTGPKWRG